MSKMSQLHADLCERHGVCRLCKVDPATSGNLCDNCGAEMFEQWKADRDEEWAYERAGFDADVAEYQATVAARDRNEPDPDIPF